MTTPTTKTHTTKAARREETLSWLTQRAMAEYLEMPGLSLTVRQAARLWSLDSHTAKSLLERLVAIGFLRVNPAGVYRHSRDN